MATSGTLVGVDVGTSSVRAALFTDSGRLLATATHDIRMWNPRAGFYQQDSEDIWSACCQCVREVLKNSGSAAPVLGIGFDATCSMVVLDKQLHPLTVSPDGEPNQNVVMWMDHRAVREAEEINASGHPALDTVGGSISLEMQTPKLLWLKRHLSSSFKQAGAFFGLPDFLTWKATGSLQRSLCSLVCKWTYMAHPTETGGWSKSYFQHIGLPELVEEDWSRLGTSVAAPGSPVEGGLSVAAATQLELPAGTPVATSLIDAYAGALGLMACREGAADPTHRLGVIAGTSSCFMALSREPCFVPGVWGPFGSVLLPGLWLSEAGQSASGRLLQHVIETHPAAAELKQEATAVGDTIHALLETQLVQMSNEKKLEDSTLLTNELHLYPDHHGNRSPHADPSLRGMLTGLTLSAGREQLALLYLATVQAVCYGSRSITEALQAGGHRVDSVYVCGGLAHSALFVQTLADVLAVAVICPDQPEAVLLGAAMLGAVAAGRTLDQVRHAMAGTGRRVAPRPHLKQFHDAKYSVFQRMRQDQLAYRALMCTATK